jgi:hypothetical protein
VALHWRGSTWYAPTHVFARSAPTLWSVTASRIPFGELVALIVYDARALDGWSPRKRARFLSPSPVGPLQVDGLGATVYEFAAMIALPFLDGVGKIHAYKDGRCVRKLSLQTQPGVGQAGRGSGVLESLLLRILPVSQGDEDDTRGVAAKSRMTIWTAAAASAQGSRSETRGR